MVEISGLFHNIDLFSRERLEQRREQFGFSMVRLELFLWDLELFLQIQKIFGDRVVLKGGAAVQFYLPPSAQRTSVDIDMLFAGSREEIEEVLSHIHQNLGKGNEFFQFEPHIPKNSKTRLPLYTYYVDVPTVLTSQEIDGRKRGEEVIDHQELKVEFISETRKRHFDSTTGTDLFVGNSPFHYNILTIDELMADKLTTLGPNTIGVQEDRKDEQVKQFYDIWMLLQHNLDKLDIKLVREKYWIRSKNECTNRNIEFVPQKIISDVLKQLDEYASIDLRLEQNEQLKNEQLKNEANNFKSLYLSKIIDFNPSNIACGAEKIKLFLCELFDGSDTLDVLEKAIEISNQLEFSEFEGITKGEIAKEIRLSLSEQFAQDTNIPKNILKGKKPKRIFWAIANKDNLNDIEDIISECIHKYIS